MSRIFCLAALCCLVVVGAAFAQDATSLPEPKPGSTQPCTADVTVDCDPYAYSNGDRIATADGTPIDPRSVEGKQIEGILTQQRKDAAANAAQRALFKSMTEAKNADAAWSILQAAKAKDPNAGTPNVYRFSNGKTFSHPDGTLISPDSTEGQTIQDKLDAKDISQGKTPKPRPPKAARVGGGGSAAAKAELGGAGPAYTGDPYRFPNGESISRADGTTIDPRSNEGRQIQAIYAQQDSDRAANRAQNDLFWAITNAKNASEAMDILHQAQLRDPNAGTKNVITGH